MDIDPTRDQTVAVPQPSRTSTLGEDHDSLARLTDEVEVASRALLTLSTRAGLDLPGTVNLTQLRALAAVEQAGPCTLRMLAEELQISMSSASRLVDRVAADGLLNRRQSEVSRRELALQVTPRGRRLLRRYEAARRAVFADVLKGVSVREARTLLRGLQVVQRQLDGPAR
jgi:DNA-binding MarR family transcriptional regulator